MYINIEFIVAAYGKGSVVNFASKAHLNVKREWSIHSKHLRNNELVLAYDANNERQLLLLVSKDRTCARPIYGHHIASTHASFKRFVVDGSRNYDFTLEWVALYKYGVNRRKKGNEGK